MDDRARHDDNSDNQSQHALPASDAEQREELHRRRDRVDDRPALTRREREDRWPIG